MLLDGPLKKSISVDNILSINLRQDTVVVYDCHSSVEMSCRTVILINHVSYKY